jgi:hypothetical protein
MGMDSSSASVTSTPKRSRFLRTSSGFSVLVAQASLMLSKSTIFLRDMSNFPKIVELRGRYFKPPYPADTIVEVTSLYSPDALIEIEAIAVVDDAVELASSKTKQ